MQLYQVSKQARKYGYRSGLEYKLSLYLKKNKCDYSYESIKIEWEDLAYRSYTPDFILYNGIIIETKGRFLAADRRKHLAIPEDWLKEKGKDEHPKRIKFTGRKLKGETKYGKRLTNY